MLCPIRGGLQATEMNAESSRSHAMLVLNVCERFMNGEDDDVEQEDSDLERTSRLNLVDLAGSERQSKTKATGARLKEGIAINKSLSTLGMVISNLVKAINASAKGKESDVHIPYRDSVLTWLLKESFGGNSKTVMLATLSPSADNYQETLSTLYGSSTSFWDHFLRLSSSTPPHTRVVTHRADRALAGACNPTPLPH